MPLRVQGRMPLRVQGHMQLRVQGRVPLQVQCCVFYYSFLYFLIKKILFTFKYIVVLKFDLYSFLYLALSVRVEFSGFPLSREVYWELVIR